MAVTISGTDGISGDLPTVKVSNGTAAAPALTGQDTDSGVFFGTNEVNISTGGTQRATVDSSGNLGVGVASPGGKLHVESAATTAGWQIRTDSVGLSNESGFYRDASDHYEMVLRNGAGGLSFLKNDGGASTANLKFNVQGSEQMLINSSGQITTPNQPSFLAVASSHSQSGTDNFVPYNSTRFNRGSHYSTSTYRFTAPVAGHYLFFANTFRNANNFGSQQILKNNTTHYSFTEYESFDNNAHHYSIAIVDLGANDYAHVKANNYNIDGNNFFGGYLLG